MVTAVATLFGAACLYMSFVGNPMMLFNNGVIWPNYYGRKYLGSIRGVAMTAMVVGSAFGPLPFGFAFDWFGGYQEILMASMVFPILGVFAALMSPPPRKTPPITAN